MYRFYLVYIIAVVITSTESLTHQYANNLLLNLIERNYSSLLVYLKTGTQVNSTEINEFRQSFISVELTYV